MSAVPATAIPDGTAAASTSVDATVANSIGDTKGVDLLTAWPSPPTGPPDLADVPMLLPMSAMTGTPSRVEYADDRATYVDYNQYWLDGSDGTLLSLQTDLLQGPSSGGEPVNVDPWDRAFYPLMSDGYASLVMVDPSGSVTLWSNGLDREELLAIGASLQARASGTAGWDAAPPDGFTLIHEGWALGAATRTLQWSDAELSIFGGVPSVIGNPSQGGVFDRLTDVGGAPALLYDNGDWAAITWSPQPDVVVLFGAFGTPDELLATARSLQPTDQAAWNDASTLAPPDDGCNSLFFC